MKKFDYTEPTFELIDLDLKDVIMASNTNPSDTDVDFGQLP